jgi:L-ascorbate metabolism protein UlaG (beta-lactamase superfamily)
MYAVPRYRGPVSDHFDGRKFHNQVAIERLRGTGRIIFTRLWEYLVRAVQNRPEPGWPVWIDDPAGSPPTPRISDLRITFVNHATLLIQMEGMNILTDPHWSERASPFSWAGPKRHRAPGIRFEDLPPIDLVLISHNHYDHMDLPTLRRLMARGHPRVLTPIGNAAFLKSKGIPTGEIDWWQSVTLPGGLTVASVPAQHFSARSFTDRDNALWGGFVVQGKKESVFFAGDTGYGPHFAEIGRRYPGIRVALLPIGAYLPRWMMKPVHVSPEEAVQAAADLGARIAIPMHYGTFKLSDEGIDDPIKDLHQALEKLGSRAPTFVVLKPGEGKDLSRDPAVSFR